MDAHLAAFYIVPLCSFKCQSARRWHLCSCCAAGVIKTALPNMDREVKEQYQVLIQAKDMGGQLGGLAGTTVVNITLSDVNDNPPRFSKSECCRFWAILTQIWFENSAFQFMPLLFTLAEIKLDSSQTHSPLVIHILKCVISTTQRQWRYDWALCCHSKKTF